MKSGQTNIRGLPVKGSMNKKVMNGLKLCIVIIAKNIIKN
jgi:hypothetical protein